MAKKAFVVTDLGPGDGGKGGVVHKVVRKVNASAVIKEGGAQGNHGVCTSRGERFAFSQWGCGTFDGARTHISHRMVVSPEGLLNEAEALRYGFGIYDPFGLLTVDRRALCATGYHGIASRVRELARGNDPRGTIGSGIGAAHRMAEAHPELSIQVSDLQATGLRDRLAAIRDRVRADLEPLMAKGFLPGDREIAWQEFSLLSDDGYLDFMTERLRKAANLTTAVDDDFMRDVILAGDGAVVVERSHGVLTDRFQGFHPHTSAIRTLPIFAEDMLRESGFDGETIHLGVTRAYAIRHGAGPMPTFDEGMAEDLLPGSHKEANRYQGQVRVGPLDLVLLRYAIACCGGPGSLQGLAVTWFDQIVSNGVWFLSDRYRPPFDPRHFISQGEIKVRFGEDTEQLMRQETLGKALAKADPEIFGVPLNAGADRTELFDLCAGFLKETLKVPVRMVSFGPTENDKVCR